MALCVCLPIYYIRLHYVNVNKFSVIKVAYFSGPSKHEKIPQTENVPTISELQIWLRALSAEHDMRRFDELYKRSSVFAGKDSLIMLGIRMFARCFKWIVWDMLYRILSVEILLVEIKARLYSDDLFSVPLPQLTTMVKLR